MIGKVRPKLEPIFYQAHVPSPGLLQAREKKSPTVTVKQFLHSEEAMENFCLKKKRGAGGGGGNSSCYVAGGGWKASKQFSEHDNSASCFNRIKRLGRKFTELSGGKKNHLWAQNKSDTFQPKG